jgi:hypothetical protein
MVFMSACTPERPVPSEPVIVSIVLLSFTHAKERILLETT